MNVYIYLTLLAGCCGYALWRGDRDARIAAVVCIVATAATVVMLTPGTARYQMVESGAMIVDLVTLGAFVSLALTSKRFWPLWIAGLQLTTTMAHLFKAINVDLMPSAYAVAARFWVYPIFIIIIVATWRGHRRRMNGAEADQGHLAATA